MPAPQKDGRNIDDSGKMFISTAKPKRGLNLASSLKPMELFHVMYLISHKVSDLAFNNFHFSDFGAKMYDFKTSAQR